MQKLVIIGNLCSKPETRTTTTGKNVCKFTVAVNRPKRAGQDNPGADFFRVNAWEKLGENCARYLDKGRKVCVVGTVSASAYQASDGSARASLEVLAHEVEFLSAATTGESQAGDAGGQYTAVDENDLPF